MIIIEIYLWIIAVMFGFWIGWILLRIREKKMYKESKIFSDIEKRCSFMEIMKEKEEKQRMNEFLRQERLRTIIDADEQLENERNEKTQNNEKE